MREQHAPADLGAARAAPRALTAPPPLLEISNAVVRVHKERFGRGPTKAYTSISGDVVVCALEDGFTTLETTLLEHGATDLVIRLRDTLHEAASVETAAAVERITGRTVRSHLAAVDPEKQVQVEVFVLEPDHSGI